MFKWLLPHDTNFFDLFDKHIALVVESVDELLQMVTEIPHNDQRARRIKELEHQADIITHQCVEELHKTFITPFQRDDIHHIISTMDDIIDYVEEIACRITIYRINAMTPEAKELTVLLKKAVAELGKVFVKLRHLGNTPEMKQSFIYIHQLENEGDVTYVNAISKLFDEFEDTRMIIKWKEIYESLEQAIDCCEDVANIIEGVILEST